MCEQWRVLEAVVAVLLAEEEDSRLGTNETLDRLWTARKALRRAVEPFNIHEQAP
jgi:hypothetical protein